MSHTKIVRLCNTIALEKNCGKLIPLMRELRDLLAEQQAQVDSEIGPPSVEQMTYRLNASICVEALLLELEKRLGEQSADNGPSDSLQWLM